MTKIIYPKKVPLVATNIYVAINSGNADVPVKVGDAFVTIPKFSSREFNVLPSSSHPSIKITKKLAVTSKSAKAPEVKPSVPAGDKK